MEGGPQTDLNMTLAVLHAQRLAASYAVEMHRSVRLTFGSLFITFALPATQKSAEARVNHFISDSWNKPRRLVPVATCLTSLGRDRCPLAALRILRSL